MAFLLVFVCRLQWIICQKVTSTRKNQSTSFLASSVNNLCARVHLGHSRSSKVMDFGTNRKCVCDFLLVRPILHHFTDTVLLTPPLFHPNFGVFLLDQITHVGLTHAFTLSYSAVKLFSKYSNLCGHRTWTSQTDGQTDDTLWHNRALRSIAR